MAMRRFLSGVSALALALAPFSALANGGGGGGGGVGGSVTLASRCPDGTQTGSTLTLNGQASIEATNVSGAITLATTDCGQVVPFNRAAGTALTWPVSTTLPQGYVVTLANVGASGSGTVTAAAGGSINGSATLTIAPNTSVTLYATDTNGIILQSMNASASSATPGGSSGQLQTNNGSGGFGAVAAPSGTVVGTTDSQSLTNKSIDASEINSGTLSYARQPVFNHPGYKASIWYQPLGALTYGTSATPVAATAYCAMAAVGQIGGGNVSATISALGTRIVTLGSSNLQLALYNNDTTVSPNRPGTLIDSTPSIVDTAAVSVSANLNATHSITPGFYWFCIQVNDTTVRYYARVGNGSDVSEFAYVGTATLANSLVASNITGGVSTTTGIGSFGTWPANMNGSTWTEGGAVGPATVFQFSSVP